MMAPSSMALCNRGQELIIDFWQEQSRVKKTTFPHIHIFWQNPDLPNPQNPRPFYALCKPD
jgi:hypothetical protein